MRSIILSTILSFMGFGSLWSQMAVDCLELQKDAAARISRDIAYLASDELGGREPGSRGAEMAARYIETSFKDAGLERMYTEGYRQRFTINSGVDFPSGENRFIYDDEEYKVHKDYFPMATSSNGNISGKTIYVKYGIEAPEKDYSDYKKLKPKKLQDKIFVMDVSSPDGIHPHSEYAAHHSLAGRVRLAFSKGATGVIFVNSGKMASDPTPHYRDLKAEKIPVIFVQNAELTEDLIEDDDEVMLKTQLEQQTIEAYNVLGIIDNGAPQTVVIGAHYDHLGMGTSSSLYRGKEPQVHNGADDNASGTAGLLELARYIKSHHELFGKFNYLFAAFSGEELGLLGSSYFLKHGPIQDMRIAYMLNMDMIGRVEDDQLAINGVGTSPVWQKLIGEHACGRLKIKTSESGIGPSDHSSFYYKDIPVLHFFSGTHMDYHKPSDDFEKINIEGEVIILQYMLTLMKALEQMPAIEFTPTGAKQVQAPRFSVTLGVLPDYMFSGKGMKIDGVTEGKPAHKAGLQAGDVVVKLGDMVVEDMMSYMKALGNHKAGDKVEVVYLREGKRNAVRVQF